MAVESTDEKALARSDPAEFSSPFSLMRRLSDDMDRILEDAVGLRRFPRLFRSFDFPETRWTPAIEVFERKGEFIVRAELPGMSKEHVTVEVSDGELVLKGERKEEKEQKQKGYYACERTYGAFYRAVPLPEGVKADEAKATFKDGVLEISMPAAKAPEKHGRQLEIK